MNNYESIKALAIECATTAIAVAGPNPFDANGNSLLPTEPQDGDWDALVALVGDTEPADQEAETFRIEYSRAMQRLPKPTIVYRLAPLSNLTDFYSAGYDGNRFDTKEEAEEAIESLRASGPDMDIEWIAVRVVEAPKPTMPSPANPDEVPWDFWGYWNATIGETKSAETAVREFGLSGKTRPQIDAWLTQAEVNACEADGIIKPECWTAFHAKALCLLIEGCLNPVFGHGEGEDPERPSTPEEAAAHHKAQAEFDASPAGKQFNAELEAFFFTR